MYDAGKGIRTRDYYDDMVAPERDTDHRVAVQDGTFELVKVPSVLERPATLHAATVAIGCPQLGSRSGRPAAR